MERGIGSLEAGKRADLAVVRRDRLHTTPAGGADVCSELVYAHTSADVDTVMVNGQVVVADGRLLSGDESAIWAEAETQQSVPPVPRLLKPHGCTLLPILARLVAVARV